MIYNIFGSEDSRDIDVMIFLDEIPSIQNCKTLCAKYEHELAIEPRTKAVDVNLCKVVDGVVVQCHKGSIDEVNNMLYYTYDRHVQVHPAQVSRPVERNVHLKVARALRGILSHLSRTEFRSEVKAALISHDADRMMECLLKIIESDFDWDIVKNNSTCELFAKTLAFQAGQVVGLMGGIELYSKSSITAHYPQLSTLLYGGYSKSDLDNTVFWLLHYIKLNYPNRDYSLIKE